MKAEKRKGILNKKQLIELYNYIKNETVNSMPHVLLPLKGPHDSLIGQDPYFVSKGPLSYSFRVSLLLRVQRMPARLAPLSFPAMFLTYRKLVSVRSCRRLASTLSDNLDL